MCTRLTDRSQQLRMHLPSVVRGFDCIFLQWEMTMTFRKYPSSTLYGATRLELDEDGRIRSQRDYFDLWGDIFDNIPWFVGPYRRFMRRKFGLGGSHVQVPQRVSLARHEADPSEQPSRAAPVRCGDGGQAMCHHRLHFRCRMGDCQGAGCPRCDHRDGQSQQGQIGERLPGASGGFRASNASSCWRTSRTSLRYGRWRTPSSDHTIVSIYW